MVAAAHPGKKSSGGIVVVILLAAALALGGHHLHLAAGGSNGNGGAARTSVARSSTPGDPCPKGIDQNKLAARFSQTRAGEIFIKCAAWRHLTRRHPVRDGATARDILKCIEDTIYNGAYSFYTKGADGHPPSAIFDFQWGAEKWQWTRVLTSLPQPGEPVYLITAYVNNNREAAATGRGGSWKDCGRAGA